MSTLARRTIRLLVLVTGLAAAGCTAPEPTPYELSILQHRFDKDLQLANPDAGVLRPQEQARFGGLEYFPIDSTYRFEVPFLPADEPEPILVAQHKSAPVPYLRIGHVEIPFPEGVGRLSVFQPPGPPTTRVWAPFVDATAGTETYGGGRYLDATLEDGTVRLDFNLAYNPFCAYNPNYICAIPPPENRLTIPVRVGEKDSDLLDGHE